MLLEVYEEPVRVRPFVASVAQPAYVPAVLPEVGVALALVDLVVLEMALVLVDLRVLVLRVVLELLILTLMMEVLDLMEVLDFMDVVDVDVKVLDLELTTGAPVRL